MSEQHKNNWIDSVIGYISPERGMRREAYRQSLDELRNYDAASMGRNNAPWRVFNDSAETIDRGNRSIIMARARDLERNSDIMNSVLSAYMRNVFGHGYNLQARIKDDKDLCQKIEQLWKLWCKKNNCDVTGTQSFSQMMRMGVRRKKIDGGILFLKRYTEGGIVPFKLQVIEVDELDENQMKPKHKKNKVVGGIEYNEYNRPMGYWIKQYSIDGMTPIDPIYAEAKDVIFYFSKKRPSQIREMSDMAQTLTRIRDVNEFMYSVSVKERILACLSVFIKRNLPGGGVGRGTDISQKTQISYDGKTLTPGMIKELNPGDEVQTVNPGGQATDATQFMKSQHRLIGAGQGISYEAVARDMSETNYSSARQSMIEDEETYIEEIELIQEVMSEIYETFIISCVLAGKLEIKGFWKDKAAYLVHDFIKIPKKWIDPYKEAKANEVAVKTGQKTFKQICAENGLDWQEQIDDMQETISYAIEKNVDLGGILYGKIFNSRAE